MWQARAISLLSLRAYLNLLKDELSIIRQVPSMTTHAYSARKTFSTEEKTRQEVTFNRMYKMNLKVGKMKTAK
jgi:hypothetical protein